MPALVSEDVFTQPALAVFSSIVSSSDEPEGDPAYMKSRFPHLEYVKMPGVGHFLMLERPAEFNRLLRSFLDKQNY